MNRTLWFGPQNDLAKERNASANRGLFRPAIRRMLMLLSKVFGYQGFAPEGKLQKTALDLAANPPASRG